MATGKFGEKLEELDLSQEEIDRLAKCMKDEKFRDLLREYAEEISDPENRKRYEEEIAMLERDRGMDVKFINPKPGHVLKTSVNGKQKCFVNICTNENLGKPKSRPSVQGNTRGMQWSIPHSVSQAREDVDKAGSKCMVYDVVFHPDTYYLLKKNARFKKMIHDTALDAVERQFGVVLDKVNIKTPKMSFKGLPMSSVIRTPHTQGCMESAESATAADEVDVRLKPPKPPTAGEGAGQPLKPFPNLKEESKKAFQVKKSGKDDEDGFIEPEYSVMHRGYFDVQNHTLAPGMVRDTWPKELVINIDLPLLSAANFVNLEVFERRLHLESVKPAKYKLDFELPYPVDENKGFAKFDKSRHRLSVTLEVLPAPTPPKLLPFTAAPLVSDVTTETANKVDAEQQTAKEANGPASSENVASKKTLDNKCETNATSPKKSEARCQVALESKPKTNGVAKTIDPPAKKPPFKEEGRRHYKEGLNWNDTDESEDPPKPGARPAPLTKNSAFLIDMVMKYEGLIRRCPQFAFHQDDYYVTFVIEVPHIFEESLWYAVYDNLLQFCCLSECLDDDMVNSVFQLWVEFGDGQRVDPQRSRVDVSGNNAVFCLRKAKPDLTWQVFQAGFDQGQLETRRFATNQNVAELHTLVYKHAKDVEANPIAVCKIARQEKDLLILELGEKGKTVAKNDSMRQTRSDLNVPDHKKNGLLDDEEEAIWKQTLNTTASIPEGGSQPPPEKNDSSQSEQKSKPSFAEEVKGHAKRKEETSHLQDSDDDGGDEEEGTSPVEKIPKPSGAAAQGVVTVHDANGTTDEVIHDHSTRSAVQLSSDSLLFEIDDDV